MDVSIRKLAVFRLRDEDFALNITDINTIEKDLTLERIDGFPANIKGIIRLRGNIIPVYSLRCKFNMGEKTVDDETRMIIANSNDILVAYEVDKMLEIAGLDDSSVMEIPSVLRSESTEYLKSVIVLKDRLVLELNVNKLLSEEEQLKIKQLLAKIV